MLQRQKQTAEQLHNILKENPKAKVNTHTLDFSPDEKVIVDESKALYQHRVMN